MTPPSEHSFPFIVCESFVDEGTREAARPAAPVFVGAPTREVDVPFRKVQWDVRECMC